MALSISKAIHKKAANVILAYHSTCAISILRIQFLGMSKDFTFDGVVIVSWSIGELGCGIVCACLPTLLPLVSKYLPSRPNQDGLGTLSPLVLTTR